MRMELEWDHGDLREIPLGSDVGSYSSDFGMANFSFWSGFDSELLGGRRSGERNGCYMDDKDPCAPVVLGHRLF